MIHCPKCKNQMFSKVTLGNMQAKLNFKINSKKRTIDSNVVEFIANGISVSVEGFVCINCGCYVDNIHDLYLQCEFTGKYDLFDSFVLVSIKENDKDSSKESDSTLNLRSFKSIFGIRSKVIHKDNVTKYEENLRSNPYGSKDFTLVVEKIKGINVEVSK